MVVYHLEKNPGNSGSFLNGTPLFVSFHWKISRSSGTSEKVVLFSHWRLSDGILCLQWMKNVNRLSLLELNNVVLLFFNFVVIFN